MTPTPSWGELSLGAIALVGIVYVATIALKVRKPKDDKQLRQPCAATLLPQLMEYTKTNTELVSILKQQHEGWKASNEKNQEVQQQMVLALHEAVILARETLDRIKDLER